MPDNKIRQENTVSVNAEVLGGTQQINENELQHFQSGSMVTDNVLPETTVVPSQPLSKQDESRINCHTKCPFKIFRKSEKIVVKEDSRLIIWRLGRIFHKKPLGPGRIVYYPGIDEITVVRIQLDSVHINDVDMLTLDMIEITVSFRIVFIITDPIKAHVNVKDYQSALKLISRSKLRDMVGGSVYEDLVRSSTKNQKDLKVLDKLNAVTFNWGIRVDSIDRTQMKKKLRVNYTLPQVR